MPKGPALAPGKMTDLGVPAIKRILRDCGVDAQDIFSAANKKDLLEVCRRHKIGPTVPDDWTIQKIKAKSQAEESTLSVDLARNPVAKRVEQSAGMKGAPDVKVAAIMPVGSWRLNEEDEPRKKGRKQPNLKPRCPPSPKGGGRGRPSQPKARAARCARADVHFDSRVRPMLAFHHAALRCAPSNAMLPVHHLVRCC